MKQLLTKKNKTSLLSALVSKDKDKIKKALGIEKPFKTIIFIHFEGKIFFSQSCNTDLNKIEVTTEQKEAIINKEEAGFDLMVINVLYPEESTLGIESF